MVTEPHRVEPDLLRGLRHADQFRKRDLPLDFRQLNPDEQRTSHDCNLVIDTRESGRNGSDAYDVPSHT